MKPSSSRTALIVGATGLIGSQLFTKLLHTPYYDKVVVLTRRSLEITNTKLTEVIFNFDEPDTSKVVADDIFCCLGTTIKKAGSKDAFKKVDLEYPLTIAGLAQKNGAEKFMIVTSMGADAKSGIFYNKVKGEVEQGLIAMKYPVLHIFHPSLLLGDRKESRLGEQVGEVLAAVFKPLMFGPLKKYRAIDSEKVANAMLSFAKKTDKGIFVHDSAELQAF
ncbi:NAD-dependent epimerase/dehydratase family protein [Dyadobacter sp. NIV53]|uniref:NAD-dependent epimerase/dehydratase family protein n=1 Tax=Dyadobacter sp. NIV53 TaxID=2861765 RepID=UPI001C874B29|nr:NAD-dependent epimerase/dehydratase family protein [Dyadobacter sp. NIV53]